MKAYYAILLAIVMNSIFSGPLPAESGFPGKNQVSIEVKALTSVPGFEKNQIGARLVEDVSIATDGSEVTLTWSPDPEATSYKVYSSELTDDGFAEDLSGSYDGESWTAPLNGDRRFYYVVSVSGGMPGNFVFVQGGTIYPAEGIYTGGLTVSDFYIDKYELTNAGWEAVMGSGGGDTYPHAWVSWFGAIEYCNRRSILEDLPPCYSYLDYGTNPDDWPSGWDSNDANAANVSCDWNASGYRLPSDAEREYAARGGLQTHGYTFSGSNDLNLVGWYYYNSGGSAHPVGQLAANELGTYDMSGNLWEWCWDEIYGSSRVGRGGFFYSDAPDCSVSYRSFNIPTSSSNYIGIRVCRSAP